MEEGGVVDFAEGLCVVQHRECLVSMQRLPVVLGHIASAAGHHHNAEEGRRLAREGRITGAFSTDAQFATARGVYHAAGYGERRRSDLLDSSLDAIMGLLRENGARRVDVPEIDGRPPTDWDDPQSVRGMREFLRERFERRSVAVRRGESEITWRRRGLSFARDRTHGDFSSLTTFRARFLYYYFRWLQFSRGAEYDRGRVH